MPAVDFVDRITPPWAKNGAVSHWWKLFRLGALAIDMILDGVYQGRRAGLPCAVDLAGVSGYGGYESVKALTKYLGPDAGVYQGLVELPPDLAKRVRHAQDASPLGGGWPSAGGIVGVLEQIAGVLGPTPPLLRIVNRSGDWWTRATDGHYELVRTSGKGLTYALDGTATANPTVARAWDWDSTTSPPTPTQGDAGDWWLVVYEPLNDPYGTSGPYTFNSGYQLAHPWDSRLGDPFYGATGAPENPDAATWGTNAPSKLVSLIFAVIKQRQTVGYNCDHVIVATDATQFAPDGSSVLPAGALGSAYPDGSWGWDSATSLAGAVTITRNSTAIYWRLSYYY